jgi:hypothetical protein
MSSIYRADRQFLEVAIRVGVEIKEAKEWGGGSTLLLVIVLAENK